MRLSVLLVLLLAACGDKELRPPAATSGALTFEGLPAETWFDEAPAMAVDLSGTWRLQKDPSDLGVEQRWFDEGTAFDAWAQQAVPGTYNLTPEGELDVYEGVAWLARTFALPEPGNQRVLLRFGACFLECRFWLNGQELATVDRPYLPIALDATRAARAGNNVLVVRTDNRITETTVPVNTVFNSGKHGWMPYGGLTRSVAVQLTSPVRVFEIVALPEPTYIHGEDDRLTVQVGLFNHGADAELKQVRLRLLSNGGDELAAWSVSDVAVPSGTSRIELGHTFDAERWSRHTPQHLYALEVTLNDDAARRWLVKFGFREVTTDGARVLVNREAAVLYGVSRHEDQKTSGPWQSDAHLEADVALLKELHVNHIRPGHYPADERLLRLLRDAGITIQEEIPVYQWSAQQMANRALVDKAVLQLEAMIQRDRNNPAIIAWSLMNENHTWYPEARGFTRRLATRAKELTPDRLTTYAMQAIPAAIFPEEYAGAHVDVVGINEYYQWYYGDIAGLKKDLRMFRQRFPDKPMVITEFGADALYGRTTPEPLGEEPWDDHSYGENWQVWFLDQHLTAFKELGFIGGVMPWAFADFRFEWNPPTGKPHPVDLTNLKGLVTLDRERKASFAYIRDVYSERRLGP